MGQRGNRREVLPSVTSGLSAFARRIEMQDAFYLLLVALFFALGAAYVRGCDRL